MATLPGDLIPVYSPARDVSEEQRFFGRFAVALAILLLLSFAQWDVRGMLPLGGEPLWVHIHAVMMVVWLGVFAAQGLLAENGSPELHRRLGIATLGIPALIVATGYYTGFGAVRSHLVPPFFTDAYFLAFTTIGTTMFAALILGGLAMRGRPEWHRRLMLGSGILLMDPALGRLVPMQSLGPWGPFVTMCIQLAFVLLVSWHDVRRRGVVHPATLVVGFTVIATLFFTTMAAIWTPFVVFASSVASTG